MAGLEVYRAILSGIRRNGYDVFTRRAGTTKPQKLGLALRTQWQKLLFTASNPSAPGNRQTRPTPARRAP